jgi:SEC-C motif-containing protein
MRSRFSAYALNKWEYIISTTHPDHSDSRISFSQKRKKILEFCQTTQFLGLEIISFEPGELVSFVTFKAILKQNGVDCSFVEKSTFKKEGEKWYYLEGEIN